jgi:hypothetical protein
MFNDICTYVQNVRNKHLNKINKQLIPEIPEKCDLYSKELIIEIQTLKEEAKKFNLYEGDINDELKQIRTQDSKDWTYRALIVNFKISKELATINSKRK